MGRNKGHGSKGSQKATDYDLSDEAFSIFLTTNQLAHRWKVKAHTLITKRSAGTGSVTHYKLGGAVRYLLADIERYERSHRVFPATGGQD